MIQHTLIHIYYRGIILPVATHGYLPSEQKNIEETKSKMSFLFSYHL
jgi:hypothetical protein